MVLRCILRFSEKTHNLNPNSFDLNLSDFIKKYDNTFFYDAFLTDVEISLEDMKKFQDKIKSTNDLIADKFAEKIHAKTNL